MADCVFRFKQFTIWSDCGGFKVGTDACLLGAWADVQPHSNILDIGTGTGVISLMLSQRTGANITAIDIDAASLHQAKLNIERSPFGNIALIQCSVQEFSSSSQKFDHVVCNPPFFQNSDKPESELLHRAKHTDHLPPNELFGSIKNLLNDNGKASIIIPFQEHEKWLAEAEKVGLNIVRKTTVYPSNESAPKRLLLELSTLAKPAESAEMFVEDSISEKRNYSSQYRKLLENFLLRF